MKNISHPISTLIVVILFFITLASCDSYYTYTYEVSNNTADPIEIIVHREAINPDTITLAAHKRKVIVETGHGNEGTKGPYFSDVKNEFTSIIVRKSETNISTKDYLSNDSWEYFEGNYAATVNEEEFEE